MKLLVSRYQKKTILGVTRGYLTRKWGYLGSKSKKKLNKDKSYVKKRSQFGYNEKVVPEGNTPQVTRPKSRSNSTKSHDRLEVIFGQNQEMFK